MIRHESGLDDNVTTLELIGGLLAASLFWFILGAVVFHCAV